MHCPILATFTAVGMSDLFAGGFAPIAHSRQATNREVCAVPPGVAAVLGVKPGVAFVIAQVRQSLRGIVLAVVAPQLAAAHVDVMRPVVDGLTVNVEA